MQQREWQFTGWKQCKGDPQIVRYLFFTTGLWDTLVPSKISEKRRAVLLAVLHAATVCPLQWRFKYKMELMSSHQTLLGAHMHGSHAHSLPFKGVVLRQRWRERKGKSTEERRWKGCPVNVKLIVIQLNVGNPILWSYFRVRTMVTLTKGRISGLFKAAVKCGLGSVLSPATVALMHTHRLQSFVPL